MSPQVRFYILSSKDPQARSVFACRLAERAWKSGVKTYIALKDENDMRMMDDLLWSFREDSFLPHAEVDRDDPANVQPDVPVTFGYGKDMTQNHDGLLINLSDRFPDDTGCFSRIAEIVVQVEEVLTITRKHFQLYNKKEMHPKSERIGKAV